MSARTKTRNAGARRSVSAPHAHAWGTIGVALALALVPVLVHAAGTDTFTPPSPVTRTLANGLKVAVFEDHRLPVVQVQLLVSAGIADEPRSGLGVASLTVQMLRQGTSSRPAKVFARELDRLGSALGVSSQRDYSSLSAGFLARDLDSGLELFSDAVLNPVFTFPELEQLRTQATTAIAQSRQNPASLADDHLAALVFGDHPYQRPLRGNLETLPGVGVDQVREFYRAHYRPDGAWLAIAGDVDPEHAFQLVQARFGGWTGTRAASPMRTVSPPPTARVRLVDLPDAKRAEIRFGWLGPARASPDVAALTLANEALGGAALSSRLAAFGGRDAAPRSALSTFREAGLISVSTATQLDSTGAVVARLRAELERFARSPVSAADLPRWTRELGNSYRLQYESLAATSGSWLLARVGGLPDDSAVRYPARLASLGTADVSAVTSHWLDPAHAVLVVVGPASRLRAALERFGTVEVVSAEASPVTIEQRPAAITTPPTSAEQAAGRASVMKAVEAHGGLTKLRSIKDSTVDADAILTTGGQDHSGSIHQVRKDPERMVYTTDFFTADTYQVLAGKQGWAKMGGITVPVTAQELDTTTVAALRFAFLADLPHLLLYAVDPASRVALRGVESVGDRQADVVEVKIADGRRYVLLIDSQNHHLLGMEQNDGEQSHGSFSRRVFGDYRPVAGVLWPYSEDRVQDGHRVILLTIKKVEVNTGVADDVFRKPGAP